MFCLKFIKNDNFKIDFAKLIRHQIDIWWNSLEKMSIFFSFEKNKIRVLLIKKIMDFKILHNLSSVQVALFDPFGPD